MKARTWLLSSPGAIAAGTALTLLVLWESVFPPWAPYFTVYAVLAIALPAVLGAYRFGSFGGVMRKHWKLILGVFAAAAVWDLGVSSLLYGKILARLGLSGDPFYPAFAG